MSETDELLDSIREFEADNQNVFGWLSPKGSIIKTADIRKTVTIDKYLESKTFKPDKIAPFILGLILLAMLVMTTMGLIKKNPNPVAIFIILPFVYGFLIYSYVNDVFVNKRLNYTISLSKNGIAYDDAFYSWADIKETAFLRLPIGKKNGKAFLVLLFNNNGYDMWELTNFRSFPYDFTTKLAN